jgi:voltage-gated potassium channel
MHNRINKRIYRIFSVFNNSSVRVGIFLSLFFLALMIAVLSVEHSTNNKMLTLFDAFWFTIVTITTIGYGDVTPVTVPGKLITVLILTSGIIVFGAVSGQIASILFSRQQKKDKGLLNMKNKRDHVIICGWKPDMDEMLRGILAANPDIIPSDIILVNTAGEEELYPILSNAVFRGINYINGDFSDEETLLRANLPEAVKILVLSDFSKKYSSMEMDSRTVLAVLLIKKLHKTIYVAAELIDDKFRKHLENEHCDEIILSKTYERRLIVSASSGTGVSHVMDKLLGGPEGQGLHIMDIPADLINRTFGELYDYFQVRESGILIGLLENTGNFYSRKQEALAEAQKNPDIAGVVSNLRKVKDMKSNRTVLAPGQKYTVKKYSRAILVKDTGIHEGGRI